MLLLSNNNNNHYYYSLKYVCVTVAIPHIGLQRINSSILGDHVEDRMKPPPNETTEILCRF